MASLAGQRRSGINCKNKMSKSSRTHKKTTPEQFELLISELRKHPDMLKRNPHFSISKVKSDVVWERITQKLNSIGPPIRTLNEWKKVFADLKTREKNNIISGKFKRRSSSADVLLNADDILEIQTKTADKFLKQLSGPTNSTLSNVEFEILEEDEEKLNETSSIKMEIYENPIETVYEPNATLQKTQEDPPQFENCVVYDIRTLEHEPPSIIKTEPDIIQSSDESNIVLADLIPSTKSLPLSLPPQPFSTTPPPLSTTPPPFSTTLPFSPPPVLPPQPPPSPARPPPIIAPPRKLQPSNISRAAQLRSRRLHSGNEATIVLFQQQLQGQTQLLETLKTSIISITERQAAAAERQALATERQAAAIERQAAATEAVLELFRSQHYDDILSKSINNKK